MTTASYQNYTAFSLQSPCTLKDGEPPFQNRIFQLERTYKDQLIQLPDQLRPDQKFKHAMNGMVQMPLKHRQTQSINHISRKPVPMFDHTLPKKSFLMSSLNLPQRSFQPFPHILSLQFYTKFYFNHLQHKAAAAQHVERKKHLNQISPKQLNEGCQLWENRCFHSLRCAQIITAKVNSKTLEYKFFQTQSSQH